MVIGNEHTVTHGVCIMAHSLHEIWAGASRDVLIPVGLITTAHIHISGFCSQAGGLLAAAEPRRCRDDKAVHPCFFRTLAGLHGGRTIITLARAGARCEFGEFQPGRVGIITSHQSAIYSYATIESSRRDAAALHRACCCV
jgi:hypothetical protein